MVSTPSSRGEPRRARDRLIFALDVGSVREVEQYVRRLRGEVGVFKVGKQLFLHAGPDVVRRIRRLGGEVFLDLKFHDIPRTVARASVEATRLGVRMLDLHATGSVAMMEEAVNEVRRVCRREGLRRPLLLAVTVLTSLTRDDLRKVGVRSRVEDQVVRLALLAREAGIGGVVTSPLEIAAIRRECGRRFRIVTPGVRPAGTDRDDQKRVLTPAEAVRLGANYVVVGRPIRDAHDPRAAAREIVADMEGVAAGRRG